MSKIIPNLSLLSLLIYAPIGPAELLLQSERHPESHSKVTWYEYNNNLACDILQNLVLNVPQLVRDLNGYCTVSSLLSEISIINRYLWKKQIAENPIKIQTQTVIIDI